jgi:hypothetical protein
MGYTAVRSHVWLPLLVFNPIFRPYSFSATKLQFRKVYGRHNKRKSSGFLSQAPMSCYMRAIKNVIMLYRNNCAILLDIFR